MVDARMTNSSRNESESVLESGRPSCQTAPFENEFGPSEFIRALPKAELHLHLEGAIEPDTVVELAANHGRQLDPAEVGKMFQYSDFTGFLLCFRAITEHLRSPDDYELITYRLMQRLAAENVLHAEVMVSVGVCHYWRRNFDDVFEAIERGRQQGERDFGVSVIWIADAVRHFGPEKAQCVVEHASKFTDRKMVGFGIGGDERRAAPELFHAVYADAARRGLRLTCHAGESVGPESVWGAIKALNTERIGHGLTCHRDSELMKFLRDRQIPVEVSVTSNLRTGCCESLEHHPLRKFFDEGLLVTLNTDDPALFGTSISREYQIAQNVYGFTDAELKQLAANSFRASFLPEDSKREYLRQLETIVPVEAPAVRE
jgi:aminodeoxyfutalosine deaminase